MLSLCIDWNVVKESRRTKGKAMVLKSFAVERIKVCSLKGLISLGALWIIFGERQAFSVIGITR